MASRRFALWRARGKAAEAVSRNIAAGAVDIGVRLARSIEPPPFSANRAWLRTRILRAGSLAAGTLYLRAAALSAKQPLPSNLIQLRPARRSRRAAANQFALGLRAPAASAEIERRLGRRRPPFASFRSQRRQTAAARRRGRSRRPVAGDESSAAMSCASRSAFISSERVGRELRLLRRLRGAQLLELVRGIG